MILCLETATSLCSAVLCDNKGVIAIRESDAGRSHASFLTVFAGELLREAGIEASGLEAIAVSKGPGSFTGLRIGVSAAKGIAYAASIPLISVETTLIMFYGFRTKLSEKQALLPTDLFCPAIDARRMEIYHSVFDATGNIVKGICAEVIERDSFSMFPPTSRIFLFGDGASKCRDVLNSENIIIDDDFRISASFMQEPAYEAIKMRRFEDVAYFEPFYLKDFLASKPAKNILGKA
ncbi:MAG: tRNA (adenosine(37)-N6)-threonylcarbamoyltransferase complex dimerization subunit type 1 TsaB [Bacteroidales bacterium]|jgi:tRNA threonylcarbamoyladenosine biosynthesis protein TsaB